MRSAFLRRLVLGSVTCLVLPIAASAEPDATPESVVESFHRALIDVMKNAESLGYQGRVRALTPVIAETFDVPFMARTSIGRHWDKASKSERERFVDTFTRFMIANYAGRFDGYSGQSFQIIGNEPARMDTVVVKTRLVNPGEENVDLGYRMRLVNGKWKVLDVYLDGTVSELALRRSEFSSIVKRDNFEALIAAIDAKIAKLAAGTGAS
jgi:phospholipid transport system substrate-binding protein